MSVDDALMETDREEGEEPDLDAARGLLPAILMGAALWGLVFAAALYYWR